jgi:hypothetical protein
MASDGADDAVRKAVAEGRGMPDEEPEIPVHWDKPAPTGPPTPLVRVYPEWMKGLVEWLDSIVGDEALVLDLAMGRAVEIVEFHHHRGLAGIDFFPEAGSGMTPSRINMVAVAAPLAVELYKQVLAALSTVRKDEFAAKVGEALAARKKAQEGLIERG